MLDKLKRKNDDKAKRHPIRGWLQDLLALGVIVVVTAGAVLWLTRPFLPYSQFPTARLFYTSNGHPYALNLQTGERLETDDGPVISIQRMPLPVQSPGALWLAYWEPIAGSNSRQLMIRGADVVHPEPILSVGPFTLESLTFSWSPDGQSITFSASPNSETFNASEEELFHIAIPSGEVTRLTNNNTRDAVPSFSPDGTQLVYVSTADGYHRLYIMDLATGQSRLVSSEIFGFHPVWSTDSRWIAYVTNQYSPSIDIWIIRPDGTGAQAVVQSPEDDRNPVWLPPDA